MGEQEDIWVLPEYPCEDIFLEYFCVPAMGMGRDIEWPYVLLRTVPEYPFGCEHSAEPRERLVWALTTVTSNGFICLFLWRGYCQCDVP